MTLFQIILNSQELFFITFSLEPLFHFMPTPHNFSGSVALNYGTPARNWTVNFTSDNLFFYDIFSQPTFDIVSVNHCFPTRNTLITECECYYSRKLDFPDQCIALSPMTLNKWVHLGASL